MRLTKLIILFKVGPIIVDISKLVLVNSGESASLFCLAVGNPMTDDLIQWRKEGNTNFIKDSRINTEIEKGRSTLWITNVSADKDSGEYQCLGICIYLFSLILRLYTQFE